jgi:hypothetical protein|tara:strand:+ start:810 stop:1097 length:288 start_codon:yes stop_codon:yes gene_type:complete
LSQNFRAHNTCSDGRTGTAANWLELQKEELGHKLDQEHNVLAEMTSDCAWCNSIKQPDGNWETFETYVSNKEHKPITHSMCPNCAEENRFNADKD